MSSGGTGRRRARLLAGGIVLLALAGAAAFGIPELGRRRTAALLPDLPDLSAAPGSVVEHLTGTDRAARRAPDDPEAVGALALAYHADGFDGPALAAYARAEALAPADPRWPYGAALVFVARGGDVEAAEALARVLARDPGHALASFRLGQASEVLGRHEEAAAAYRRAAELDVPGSPWALASERCRHPRLSEFALTGAARLAMRAGRVDEAEALLATATESGGVLGAAHALLADLCSRQGRTVEAAEATRRAEESPRFQGPADPFVLDLEDRCRHSARLRAAGERAVALRLDERAEYLFRRALENEPGEPPTVAALAGLLARTGRAPEAVAMLLRGRQAAPSDSRLAEALVKVAHKTAIDFTSAQRQTEAEAMLRRLVTTFPEDPDLRTILAEYYEKVGDETNAVLEYRETLKRRATPDIWMRLAHLLKGVGYEGEATMAAQEALKLDPGYREAKDFLGER